MTRNFVRTIATGVFALGLGSSAAIAQQGVPFGPDVPEMPAKLEAPAGFTVFFKAHALGTQNYVCLPAATGVAWKFVAPEATLYQTFRGEVTQQLATHFLGANPWENGLARPTWQYSGDSSRVWARLHELSTDSNFVEAGAIPWLSLDVAGDEAGPQGGAFLTRAKFVQRLNTSGGSAPSTGCSEAAQIGAVVLVPYSADYFFYKPGRR